MRNVRIFAEPPSTSGGVAERHSDWEVSSASSPSSLRTSTEKATCSASNDAPSSVDSSSSSTVDYSNDEDNDAFRTWALCPVAYERAAVATLLIAVYSAVFLFYAQYHIVLLLIMTSLIAIWIVCLFTSGMLCVLYVMFRISYMESPQVEMTKSATKVSTISMMNVGDAGEVRV